MAAHTLALFRDPALRARLVSAGRRFVERHHDWSQIGRRLIDVYQDARAAYRRCA